MENQLLHLRNDPIFTSELEQFILTDRKLSLSGTHGISHWLNVRLIGEKIADINGADKKVVTYFSLLHDSRRIREVGDFKHGLRASKSLQIALANDNFLDLDNQQIEQLLYAIANHNITKAKSNDITIQTCWDSDRLDLWRVLTSPNPKFLYTEFGKSETMLKFSKNLNL